MWLFRFSRAASCSWDLPWRAWNRAPHSCVGDWEGILLKIKTHFDSAVPICATRDPEVTCTRRRRTHGRSLRHRAQTIAGKGAIVVNKPRWQNKEVCRRHTNIVHAKLSRSVWKWSFWIIGKGLLPTVWAVDGHKVATRYFPVQEGVQKLLVKVCFIQTC